MLKLQWKCKISLAWISGYQYQQFFFSSYFFQLQENMTRSCRWKLPARAHCNANGEYHWLEKKFTLFDIETVFQYQKFKIASFNSKVSITKVFLLFFFQVFFLPNRRKKFINKKSLKSLNMTRSCRWKLPARAHCNANGEYHWLEE